MAYLVGRESQLNSILDSIDKTIRRDESKHVLFIIGEAGVGKSTLMGSLKNSLNERGRFTEENRPLTAYAVCTTPIAGYNIGSSEALKPWADILQKLLSSGSIDKEENSGFDFKKFMVETAPSWMKLIPVIGSTLEGAVEIGKKAYDQKTGGAEDKIAGSQEQIFQQYVNFLFKASEQKPLVLMLDDFHWADDSSVNLLFTAAKQLSNKRIFFIVSYRDIDVKIAREGKGHPIFHISNELQRYNLCDTIEIERFTKSQVSEFLVSVFKGKGISRDKDFLDWLINVSEGNALYIVNFLAKLEEEGYIDKKTGAILKDYEEVKAPEGNLALIRSRLKNLPEDEQEVPRYASVEGNTFTMEVLKEILEEKPLKLLQKLRILEDKSGLIESLGKQLIHTKETTAYKFSHVQVHKAMYESLEDEERELIHQAVFNVLVKEWETAKELNINIVNIGVKLAAHAQALGNCLFAAEALLEAAKESWRSYAAEETLKQLNEAFENLDKTEEKGEKNIEKLVSLKIECLILKSEVHELKGLWKDCINIYHSVLELAERLPENLKKKYIALANSTVGNSYRLLGDYKTAMKVFQTALEISTELDDKFNIAYATGNIGVINFNQGNYDNALECYGKKLIISEELKDEKGIANVMGNMGNLYYARGEYEKALECHNKKLSISEKLNDQRNIAFCISNIGSIYYDRGNYDEALKCFQRKLSISEQLGDRVNISSALGNLGNIYFVEARYDKAIEYQKMKLAISEELSDLQSIARACGNLGVVYLRIKDFEKSLECAQRALSIGEELGDKQVIARASGSIGAVYSELGNYDKAIEYYKKELPICEEIGDKLNIGVALGNLGNNYFHNKNYKESYSCLTKALELHKFIGFTRGIRVWYYSFSMIFLEEYLNTEKMPEYLVHRFPDSSENWRDILLNEAEKLANDSNDMLANQLSHDEEITNVKVLLFRIRSIRGTDSEIKEELKDLMKNFGDYHKAVISYWIWKLSLDENEKLKYGNESASLYEKLYVENPNPEFKEQADEIRSSLK